MVKAFLEDSDFEANFSSSSSSFLRKKYQFKWWHAFLFALLLFPFVSIFILFGLSGASEDLTESFIDLSTSISTDFGEKLSFSSIGMPLSFSAQGPAQFLQGGGTSLYLNTLSEDLQASCPSYSSLVSLDSGSFLSSYSYGDNKSRLMVLESDKKTVVKSFLEVDLPVKKVVTLSSSSSFVSASSTSFLTLSYDTASEEEKNCKLVAGEISSKMDITLFPEVLTEFTSSSLPELISLQGNKFAIAYERENDNNLGLFLKYGELDAISHEVTLSEEHTLISYTPDSFTFSLISFNNQLLFSYYLSSTGNLQSTLITEEGSLFPSISLSNSKLFGSLASTQLSPDLGVIVFSDQRKNSLNVISVQLLDENEGLLTYGSILKISAASTSKTDLDVNPLSNDGLDFIVVFSDNFTKGPLAVICEALNYQITRVSPNINLILSSDSQDKSLVNWSAIAASSSKYLNSRSGIMYIESNKDCSIESDVKFLLLDRLPLPVGVSNIYKKIKRSETLYHEVSLSGRVANIQTPLEVGKKYYTNSRGELLSSSNFYGRTGVFIYEQKSNTIVLEENLIGIALDKQILDVNLFKGRNS